MSHFSMLVITDEKPLDHVLERVLMPYHEFECTGLDNEFVVDVDVTNDARTKYASDTEKKYKDPTGISHDKYMDRFYREPTAEEAAKIGRGGGSGFSGDISFYSKDWKDGKGYRAKVHFIPEGWEEVEVYTHDTKTFAEFAAEYYGYPIGQEDDEGNIFYKDETDDSDPKYGYVLVKADGEVRVIDHTNPNAKWDWYVVGGRWSGLLSSTNGGIKGQPGLGGAYNRAGVDICQRKDLDLEAMVAERRGLREKMFVSALEHINKSDAPAAARDITVEQLKGAAVRYSEAVAGARKVWEIGDQALAFHAFLDESCLRDASVVRALRRDYGAVFSWELDLPEGTIDADAWIKAAPALSAWGVIKDGEWYEKGSMGWFGMSSDNKDENAWVEELNKLVLDLPGDKWIAVVDCHI